MVMFKARFKPAGERPGASGKPQASQQQQQPQPDTDKDNEKEKAPPIEKERGPQYPVKEPEPSGPPARAFSRG